MFLHGILSSRGYLLAWNVLSTQKQNACFLVLNMTITLNARATFFFFFLFWQLVQIPLLFCSTLSRVTAKWLLNQQLQPYACCNYWQKFHHYDCIYAFSRRLNLSSNLECFWIWQDWHLASYRTPIICPSNRTTELKMVLWWLSNNTFSILSFSSWSITVHELGEINWK